MLLSPKTKALPPVGGLLILQNLLKHRNLVDTVILDNKFREEMFISSKNGYMNTVSHSFKGRDAQ